VPRGGGCSLEGRWLGPAPPRPGLASLCFRLGASVRACGPPPPPWPARGSRSSVLCSTRGWPDPSLGSARCGAALWCCVGPPPLLLLALLLSWRAPPPGQRPRYPDAAARRPPRVAPPRCGPARLPAGAWPCGCRRAAAACGPLLPPPGAFLPCRSGLPPPAPGSLRPGRARAPPPGRWPRGVALRGALLAAIRFSRGTSRPGHGLPHSRLALLSLPGRRGRPPPLPLSVLASAPFLAPSLRRPSRRPPGRHLAALAVCVWFRRLACFCAAAGRARSSLGPPRPARARGAVTLPARCACSSRAPTPPAPPAGSAASEPRRPGFWRPRSAAAWPAPATPGRCRRVLLVRPSPAWGAPALLVGAPPPPPPPPAAPCFSPPHFWRAAWPRRPPSVLSSNPARDPPLCPPGLRRAPVQLSLFPCSLRAPLPLPAIEPGFPLGPPRPRPSPASGRPPSSLPALVLSRPSWRLSAPVASPPCFLALIAPWRPWRLLAPSLLPARRSAGPSAARPAAAGPSSAFGFACSSPSRSLLLALLSDALASLLRRPARRAPRPDSLLAFLLAAAGRPPPSLPVCALAPARLRRWPASGAHSPSLPSAVRTRRRSTPLGSLPPVLARSPVASAAVRSPLRLASALVPRASPWGRVPPAPRLPCFPPSPLPPPRRALVLRRSPWRGCASLRPAPRRAGSAAAPAAALSLPVCWPAAWPSAAGALALPGPPWPALRPTWSPGPFAADPGPGLAGLARRLPLALAGAPAFLWGSAARLAPFQLPPGSAPWTPRVPWLRMSVCSRGAAALVRRAGRSPRLRRPDLLPRRPPVRPRPPAPPCELAAWARFVFGGAAPVPAAWPAGCRAGPATPAGPPLLAPGRPRWLAAPLRFAPRAVARALCGAPGTAAPRVRAGALPWQPAPGLALACARHGRLPPVRRRALRSWGWPHLPLWVWRGGALLGRRLLVPRARPQQTVSRSLPARFCPPLLPPRSDGGDAGPGAPACAVPRWPCFPGPLPPGFRPCLLADTAPRAPQPGAALPAALRRRRPSWPPSHWRRLWPLPGPSPPLAPTGRPAPWSTPPGGALARRCPTLPAALVPRRPARPAAAGFAAPRQGAVVAPQPSPHFAPPGLGGGALLLFSPSARSGRCRLRPRPTPPGWLFGPGRRPLPGRGGLPAS